MSASRDRYGRPASRRVALAPGLLAAVALLVGAALLDGGAPGSDGGSIVIRYATSILALIVMVFAYQARHWWWIPVMLAIAVIWNPVFPLPLDGPLWAGAQYVAVLMFALAGVLIKVPVKPDDARP